MTIEKVLARDICVGCGACSVVTNGAISIELNTRGYYSANLSKASAPEVAAASTVCPFSDDAPNEDEIGQSHFGDLPHSDPKIGKYQHLSAGRITDTDEIPRSSSGGLTNWIAKELLRLDEVDAIVHVGAADEGPLFEYRISRSVDEVNAQRKSQYYSTTLADVLAEVKQSRERYALVGVPCFIRAARLACQHDAGLARALRYFIGIVCGHLKAAGYAESLAWQQGIAPAELQTVDFRIKDPRKSTRHYRFGALRRGESEMIEASPGTLLGATWGHATFQLNACNFCDDVYAETADIALGDAWLPKYEADWRGANVIVVRNARLSEILHNGVLSGALDLESLSAESVVAAQAGNYRHRHQGLAVRLADDISTGDWVPQKRVRPGYDGVSPARLELIRTRRRLSQLSFKHFEAALAANNLSTYLEPMTSLIAHYDRLGRQPLWPRMVRRARREMWTLRRRLSLTRGGSTVADGEVSVD